jgi:hypothetical protein
MARTIIALLLLSACSSETATFAVEDPEADGGETSTAVVAATGGAFVALGTGGASQATGGAPKATGGIVAATGGRSTGGVTATGGVTVTAATGGVRATGGMSSTGGAGIYPSDTVMWVCASPNGGCKAYNGIEGGGWFDPVQCGAAGDNCLNCPASPYLPLNSSKAVVDSLEPSGSHVLWCQKTAITAWCLLPSGFYVVQCRPPV